MNNWEKTRMIGGWIQGLVALITESIRTARSRRAERSALRRLKKYEQRRKQRKGWKPNESQGNDDRDYKTF